MVKVKGWEKTLIKNVAEIYSGGTPSTYNTAFWDGEIVWVTPSDITSQKNKYTYFSGRKISEAGLSVSKLLPKGTILLCSRATIGELSIAGLPLTTNQGFKSLICFDDTDNEFLYYALQPLKQKMIEQSFGTTFLEISKKQLGEIEILKPKEKKEQMGIAKVLSDTDEYIVTLKKLIEKKKAIKTGTMQELLTGKRRLKGFTGEWKERQLGKIIRENPKSSISVNVAAAVNGQFPFFVSGERTGKYNSSVVSGENIFLNTGGRAGVKYYCGDAHYSTDTYSIYGKEILTKFLYYYLETNIQRIDKLFFQGNALQHLQKPAFREFVLRIPPTKKEQTAIAEVLSDMDAEIEALSAKLQKAKAVKVGMMQQLLTGQIRLVEVATGDSRLEDAVVISGIVDIWGREQKYPLGRVKVAKLFYLYTRKVGGDISRFHEHAAGPYDETVRHGGGEVLATQSGYIEIEDRGDSSKFSCGKNIEEAKKQLYDFDAVGTLKWLDDNFRMTSKEELELLATVDLARLRLEQTGRTADAQSVYDYISQSTDWAAKLDRADFHISNIAKALKQSHELFGQGGQA